VPIFGATSSWLYFILVATICLLPNAALEIWQKIYHPCVFQQLQHVPQEVVAARAAAEVKAVQDAQLAEEEAAKAASVAVAASKRGRRAGRTFSNLTQLSNRSSHHLLVTGGSTAGEQVSVTPKKLLAAASSADVASREIPPVDAAPSVADAAPLFSAETRPASNTHYTYSQPSASASTSASASATASASVPDVNWRNLPPIPDTMEQRSRANTQMPATPGPSFLMPSPRGDPKSLHVDVPPKKQTEL
jgi:hypothetical protein